LIVQKDSDFNDYYNLISELQGYAVEVRYPNEIINLSDEKVINGILIAKNIRNVITLKMKINIDYNEIIDQ
jgi:hypothetical protein